MLQQNFAYIIDKRALVHPQDAAVIEAETGRRYSYLDLVQRSCRLASALRARGVGKGDRVCCLTKNSIEYIDLFLAAARLGAVLCPLNYRLSSQEMAAIVADAAPAALAFDIEFAELARGLLERSPAIGTIYYFGPGLLPWGSSMEAEVAGASGEPPAIVGDSEDPLLMLFTAGSTGRPKGVPLKHRHLFFSAMNWIVELGLSRSDYTLTVLPLFHIGGHILWTMPHLIIGAKVLLLRRFEPEATLRLLEQHRITNTYLIPAMARMILALPDWKRFDLGSVRFIGSGGEAVSESITSAFVGIGIPILNSYGLTETCDGTTSIRPDDALGRPANCIGKPLPFIDVKIVDGDGAEVPVGEPGQIVHRGASVVDAYWQRPEETAKAFRDGWFHTGDIATRDEDGYVYFLGRKDDMILTGGENVYPAEVEQAILSHPKVADAAVLGVPDEKWGQRIMAVVAPREGSTLDERDLDRHLGDKLSSFKRPRSYEFVAQLPKIGSGKLDRALIKKTYGTH